MSLPLQVFILGLITVFFVLAVVVATGHTIIWFVNKYFEPAPVANRRILPLPGIDSKKVAAISAAVNTITRGKGKVTRIEKNQDQI